MDKLKRRVLILGGGFGDEYVAGHLGKLLSKQELEEIEIVLPRLALDASGSAPASRRSTIAQSFNSWLSAKSAKILKGDTDE